MSALASLYEHVPHPHIKRRRETGPVKLDDQRNLHHSNPVVRFNSRLALACTAAVGSMWCAYAFAVLAVAGLPAALKPGNIGFLFWISSDLLQLTLLSVIIVGQNLQPAHRTSALSRPTWTPRRCSMRRRSCRRT